MMNPLFQFAVFAVLAHGLAPRSAALTTNLLPQADSAIRSTTPDLNSGTATTLLVGVSNNGSPRNRAFLKFDLTGIPTNASVTSATLQLIVVQNLRPPAMFGLSPCFTNWVETEVTWNNRATATPWTAAGGQSGTDFSSVPAATGFLDATGNTNVFSGVGLVSNVQGWVNNPALNFGWILIATDEPAGTGKMIGSRENPGNEPVLTVNYTLPIALPLLKALPPTNGFFHFNFQAEANQGYLAQFSPDLPGTNWQTFRVLNPALESGEQEVQDITPLTSSNRFYRLQLP